MRNLEAFDAHRETLDPYSFAEKYFKVLRDLAGLYPEIEYVNPEPLVRDNDSESTLFTTSGVQFMNQFIKGESKPSSHAFLITQPVVRMNYLPKVALGSYSSFVNFGSMQLDVSQNDHDRLSDEFVGVLADVTGKDIIEAHALERDHVRDGFEYTTHQAFFSIDGLEVADSLFHEIRNSDGVTLTLSELGSGLERLLYGTSPEIMRETTGIKEITDENITEIDAFRGAVLIAGNNVQPSNNNQGYQLRRLLKRLPILIPDLEPYINALTTEKSVYDFWYRMGGIVISASQTIEIVQNETWRNVNLAALQKAKVKSKAKMDFTDNPVQFAEKYGLAG